MTAVNLLASFSPAAPGTSEPLRLRWKGNVIKIAVSTSVTEPNANIKFDSDVFGAIRRSVDAWQAAADIQIEIERSDKQSLSPSGISGDGVSLITIAQSVENVLLFSKEPMAESAKTRVFYKNSQITEADIVLNPFQQFSTDGTFGTFDLESTLTHEIGHLLGLRHSGVLGASMSSSLARNGTFGLADVTGRKLAESDIAAIRDLYGTRESAEACCGAIAGKLTTASAKPARGVRVWAEESSTGRVAAQTDTAPDGSFKLGGLSEGTYGVFWQREGDAVPSSVGGLGTIKIEKGETRTLNEKVSLTRANVTLSYVGVNNQLTDSAVTLASDREHSIFLGGKNLDRKKVTVEFNSPYITVMPNSMADQDFGDGVSVISFNVAVHVDTPPGVYSIFATAADGSMTSLIGALKVQ